MRKAIIQLYSEAMYILGNNISERQWSCPCLSFPVAVETVHYSSRYQWTNDKEQTVEAEEFQMWPLG